MKIKEICSEIRKLAIEVGEFQLSEISKVQKQQIESKAHNSLVSYVDKESERMIVERAKSLIPESGFITEEDAVENKKKEYTWIIDPLDGTTNYLHGIPHYCISIALAKNDELLLGVVYDPSMKECFHAVRGEGAFLNNDRISVTSHEALKDALIVTGFPFKNDYDVNAQLKVLQYWLLNTRGMRRLGSAALDLAYVACGRLDAYYEGFLNSWDLAAGALIVQEAGGVVKDLDEGDDFLEKGSIIATSPKLFTAVMEPIREHLKS